MCTFMQRLVSIYVDEYSVSEVERAHGVASGHTLFFSIFRSPFDTKGSAVGGVDLGALDTGGKPGVGRKGDKGKPLVGWRNMVR